MTSEISALLVAVPELDPVIDAFRSALDSGAALGVPAHVTLLYPFMPTGELDDGVLTELGELFASRPAFGLTFSTVGWFDRDVVYVRPEPDDGLREMTAAIAARWPQWPPYGGAHPDPTPHVTIGDNGDVTAMRSAARAVGRSLPIEVEVSEVQLHAGTDRPGTWSHRMSFPLGVGLRDGRPPG